MSKKWLALALKFLVSGFLIWFLTRQIDFGDAGRRLADLDPVMLALAFGILFVQVFVGGARWSTVLDAIGRPRIGLRPMTTAWAPSSSTWYSRSKRMMPAGVHAAKPGIPRITRPSAPEVMPSTSFANGITSKAARLSIAFGTGC